MSGILGLFNRGGQQQTPNLPEKDQQFQEERKEEPGKRGAIGAGGLSGGTFLNAIGLGGYGGSQGKGVIKSSLKHMETFAGKNIIMTGVTGGIGSEVVK